MERNERVAAVPASWQRTAVHVPTQFNSADAAATKVNNGDILAR
jgi:hypothetical protein